MSVNKKKNILIVMKVVLFVAIYIFLKVLFQQNLNQIFSSKEKVLDAGWNIKIGSEEYQDVSLSYFKVPSLEKGTVITLSRPVYEEDYAQNTLRMMVRYSAIRVYLDEDLIYENGCDYEASNRLLGSGYCWIEFPDYEKDAELRIELKTGEKNAFAAFEEIVMMDSTMVFGWLICNKFSQTLTAAYLSVQGLILFFIALLIWDRDKKIRMLLWLGLFSLQVSGWMFASSRVLELIVSDLHIIGTIEYICMYLAFVSLLFFVSVFLQEKNLKKYFRTLGLVFFGVELVLVILNETNLIHFPKTVHFFQTFAIISIISVIVTLNREVRTKKKMAEKIFMVGVICFICFVALELIRYRYNKICLPANALTQSVIPLGAMIFTIAMFGAFFARMMERVAENMERKTLYDMAYQDALTGISNRAWCEQIMEKYDTENKPISIINLDLNLFKNVNDTYGHAFGDELLIRFAKILQSNFRENDCVGRMGGDEFIVILDYLPDHVMDAHIERLQNRIMEENKNPKYPYQISVSYGVASDKTGYKKTSWELYEEADKKMYEYKQQHKMEN